MGHIERKIREKENLRAAMLDAAIQIAREEGWPALTIRKIADRIEYTPPIVYEFFENKEALIRELVLTGFRKLHQDYDMIFQEEADPKKQLRRISIEFWNFAFENAELYQLMFSLERPTPNDEIRAIVDLIRGMFLKMAGGDAALSDNLMFNWMCLQNGTISTVLNLGAEKFKEKGADPYEMFLSFIDRFLKSF